MDDVSPYMRGPEVLQSTFADYGAERLSKVCHAIGMDAYARDAVRTFRSLLEPWGDRVIGETPVWPSDIVDDHTPFEISATVGGNRSEVRVLVEAQGDPPTLRTQQEAGRALTLKLERDFGADLTRLRLIEDLFLPEDPQGIFAMWHAVSFRSDGKLDLKVYLNLQAQGRERAPILAEEALARVGFPQALPALRRIAARRGLDADELLYFSLDLAASAEARVKVYFRHHHATADDLENALALSPEHAPGKVSEMCRALGGGEGPFSSRAPVSCFSYTEGDTEGPSSGTVYFPITGYVNDDLEAKSRISAYLAGLGVPAGAYEAAVDAFTTRPLESGVGMQSYVSFRHDRGVPRLTVYFGPEAYSTEPPRSSRRGPASAPRSSPPITVRQQVAEAPSQHDLSGFRARFPLLDERLYFASQCLGPLPTEALEDLDEYRRTLLLRKRALPLWMERMAELTALTEKLLGAPPGSVALRDSATAAQAAIAASIEPRAGRDGIVVSRHDFHSTRYLWAAQQRRGFRIDEIEPRARGGIAAHDYLATIDARTAVVTAPLVSPRTGALLEARAVIRAAHDHGALVVLDAYQAVGVVPVDVQALGADVVVGGMHKWLGGASNGLAFMYVRPSLAEKLEPAYPGWFGCGESVMTFDERYVLAPGARRFQQGSPAVEPLYTSRAGLRLALEIGVERIRARSLELTGRMLDRFEARGLRVSTPRRPELRGGMICLELPDSERLEAALRDRGIDVDHRPGAGLRVAPHFCHREDECDRVVDAIAEVVRS
jgi:DMATS type aromatic prenyltransferase